MAENEQHAAHQEVKAHRADTHKQHRGIEDKVDKVMHHVTAMHHTVKIIGWTVGILVVVGIFIGWWL